MGLERLRNIGIVAHIDAGKTTVSERILFYSGVEHRVGQVDEGTAVMDWMPEERERGITITSAATRVPWRDHDLNLIDTPGHVDFTVEVERCMRVLDGAVLVLDAVMGVQAQSETVYRQMARHHVPYIAFANKCDRPGADVLAVAADMRARLEAPAVPVQYPIGQGGEVTAIVDLVSRETWFFERGEPARSANEPWPADIADELEVLRSELIDALAEEDEALLNAVVEEREPDVADMRRAMRRRVIEGTLIPLLCGAALRDVGVQPLLDAIVDYLPSPLDLRNAVGTDDRGNPVECPPEPDAPLACLAFKLHAGPHGDLTFVRIYSGEVRPGDALFNPRVQKKERVSRILRIHADAGVALELAGPGDIVALTGLKWTGTGDTLCRKDKEIVLEQLVFPDPVITLIVEPSSSADRDKLRQALGRLAHEDPSLFVREDEETGQWSISGMGELHLEVIRHRLENEFKVDPRVGQPRVAYREAIREAARGSGRVDRTIGGKEVFGAVEVEVLPSPDSPAPRVEWVAPEAVPKAFHAAIEQALLSEAEVGPRLGYPLSSIEIRVVGGDVHEQNNAEIGYTLAAVQALREALADARIELLEPVMAFEIQTPSEFSSGIIADLNGRRAEVGEVLSEGDTRIVLGRVPLSQMFGYSTTVRSLSQGRAGFSMTPSGYRGVPEEELEARGLVWS